MKIKLLDGAMGTNLIAAGMPKGISTEKWILENETTVTKLQNKYIESGSDILYAPTFGANPAVLKRESQLGVEVNEKLVALTRRAAEGKAVTIAGDISSTGLMVKPYGSTGFEELASIFGEQGAALEKAGVDMFVIETSISLKEATAAYYGVRSVSDKPVFVTFTIEKESRTLSGELIEACLVALQSKGVAAVGVNCSDGGENVLEAVKRMARYATVPIIAKPNAGMPTVCGDSVSYSLSPKAYADFCQSLAKEGAFYIGGCCGTTPEHIAALNANRPDAVTNVPINGVFATDGREVYEVSKDMVLPEKIQCDDCLLFNLPEADEASCFRIYVDSDSADIFDETPLNGLPLVIDGDSVASVSAALRVYPGRAVLDRESTFSEEEKRSLAKRYGVIIFD